MNFFIYLLVILVWIIIEGKNNYLNCPHFYDDHISDPAYGPHTFAKCLPIRIKGKPLRKWFSIGSSNQIRPQTTTCRTPNVIIPNSFKTSSPFRASKYPKRLMFWLVFCFRGYQIPIFSNFNPKFPNIFWRRLLSCHPKKIGP